MHRKFNSLAILLLMMIALYGTYLIFKESTVQILYASHLSDLQQEINFEGPQSYSSPITTQDPLHESDHAVYNVPHHKNVKTDKLHVNAEPRYVSERVPNHESNREPIYEDKMSTKKEVETLKMGINNDQQTIETVNVDIQHEDEQNLGEVQVDKRMKIILWYDRYKQSMLGHSTKVNFSLCEYKKCKFQYMLKGKRKPVKPFQADAVLVQSRAIYYLNPPPKRDQNQVFVFAVRDAFPKTLGRNQVAKRWTNLFNWTMTYRLDSDFVYRYSNVIERSSISNISAIEDNVLKQQLSIDIANKNYERIFSEKTGEALWFVSHCHTNSGRESYVKQLQKVINVKIYGFCGEKAPCPKGDTSCFDKLALKYKFYLAFENTFYADYVTEKVYHWFDKDVIVVARGGSNYSKILPPGTVIDAGDFKTPAELGKYLKQLGNDKERYIAHLKRKDNYVRTSKLVPVQEANCKLCEYLHTLDTHRKSYNNIFGWWLQNWRN